ncbi:MAG: TfuA-like protein, partial [Actinomycetota bacterium]
MLTDQRDIVVFLGPTLPVAEAEALLPATYLPPVQQGSVYEAAQSRPRAIAIIDGYFGWVPSVWHKEILWALDQGIAVYGASSMGALRAAELHQFGMVGHGAIFQDYLEGRLHDDDEVAIVHADEQERFRPLSAAMVNIRYTLAKAESLGLISAASEAALIHYFKGRFFADRRLQGLRAQLGPLSLIPDEELEGLAGWLPGNYRDVKQEDAVGLLRRLGEEESRP